MNHKSIAITGRHGHNLKGENMTEARLESRKVNGEVIVKVTLGDVLPEVCWTRPLKAVRLVGEPITRDITKDTVLEFNLGWMDSDSPAAFARILETTAVIWEESGAWWTCVASYNIDKNTNPDTKVKDLLDWYRSVPPPVRDSMTYKLGGTEGAQYITRLPRS